MSLSQAAKATLFSMTVLCFALQISFAESAEATAQRARMAGVQSIQHPIDLPPSAVPVQPIEGPGRRRALDQGGEDCSSATLISSFPTCVSGTTIGYNNDVTQSCLGATGAPDVAYEFTPAFDIYLTISLCASTYDTYVEVWETNSNCDLLSLVGCGNHECGLNACMEDYFYQGGTRYLILVSGDWGESGNYTLNITEGAGCGSVPCPSSGNGENCSSAILIPALPYCANGTTAGFVNDVEQSCLGATGAPDVAYVFTPPFDIYLTISLCAADYDTYVEVWETNANCDLLNFVGCGNHECGTGACMEEYYYQGGTRYLILVSGDWGESGNYSLNITEGAGCGTQPCPSTNSGEDCSSAILVGTFPQSFAGSTLSFSDDYNDCVDSPGAPDVVFAYTPDHTHLGNIETCNNTYFSNSLYLYRDGVFTGTCGTRNCGSFSGNYYYNANLWCVLFETGHTYCIVLDGQNITDAGNFEIRFTETTTQSCTVGDYCQPAPHETEPNSSCSNDEVDPDLVVLGDTIYATICPPGDKDYYSVFVPEDNTFLVGIQAGPTCDQNVPELGLSYVYPNSCYEFDPCNNCSWIIGCGPDTVQMVVEGVGSCFTGKYMLVTAPFTTDYDACDPIACQTAVPIVCGVPTLVNTCDGCQTPICQTYENGCSGTRHPAGPQKFFRLNVPAAGVYNIDVSAPIGNANHDVQYSLFTDCVLPRTSCVAAQDQNAYWHGVGPENEESGSVFLNAGTYFLHLSLGPFGPCGDLTVLVTCPAGPCSPVDSVVVKRDPLPSNNVRLSWRHATGGLARIYAATTPNAAFPAGYTLISSVTVPAGHYTSAPILANTLYKNFIVTMDCP